MTIDQSPHNSFGTDWRILGELELPIGVQTDSLLNTWLAKTLNPLKLHMDFLSKVAKSAQEAVIHAQAAERVQTEFEHIHLRVSTPWKKSSKLRKEQAWGFFRIEKVGVSTKNANLDDLAIEIYLYLEG
jgi:hypothetical protein